MHPNAPVAAFGRLLIATLFIIGGFGNVAEPDATKAAIAAAGIWSPALAYAAAIAIELGGGVLLIVGYRTKAVAAALAVLSIIIAVLFHRVHDDLNQQIHFLKNIAIAGGLLQLAAFGAGDVSLDADDPDALPDRIPSADSNDGVRADRCV